MLSQLSFTTTTIVPTAATIAATTPVTRAGAPKIIAPTAVIATPKTIRISFSQLNPFFSMSIKLVTANNEPVITLPIPVIAVPIDPNTNVKDSFNVPAPPAVKAITFASLENRPVPSKRPPDFNNINAFDMPTIPSTNDSAAFLDAPKKSIRLPKIVNTGLITFKPTRAVAIAPIAYPMLFAVSGSIFFSASAIPFNPFGTM